jgi:predicted nucleotidyltransferase
MGKTLLSRKGSGKLLSTLLKSQKRKFSINELAKEAGVPFGSAWNILQEWERFKVVEMERIGRTNAVSLGGGPHLEAAKKLLSIEVSPQRASLDGIASFLADKGVKSAFLFGSVAEGREIAESDVDIALVAGKEMDCASLAVEAYEEFAVKVVFLAFANEGKLMEFLEGKTYERVV